MLALWILRRERAIMYTSLYGRGDNAIRFHGTLGRGGW